MSSAFWYNISNLDKVKYCGHFTDERTEVWKCYKGTQLLNVPIEDFNLCVNPKSTNVSLHQAVSQAFFLSKVLWSFRKEELLSFFFHLFFCQHKYFLPKFILNWNWRANIYYIIGHNLKEQTDGYLVQLNFIWLISSDSTSSGGDGTHIEIYRFTGLCL